MKNDTIHAEGYWYSDNEPWFPMPQPYLGLWLARDRFISKLKNLQLSAAETRYRGMSLCRLCKCVNGSSDFTAGDWTWPSGLLHYVENHNVRPSVEFEKFVLDTDFASPDLYRQWYSETVRAQRLQRVRDMAKGEYKWVD
jgi:hypothetical protein